MSELLHCAIHFKGQLMIYHDECSYDFANRGPYSTNVNIQYTYLVQIPEYLYNFYKHDNNNLKFMIEFYLLDSECNNYERAELCKIMFIDDIGNYGSLSGLRFTSNVCNIISISKDSVSELEVLLNPTNIKEVDMLMQSMEKYYSDRSQK